MTVITINPSQVESLAVSMRQAAGEYDAAALRIANSDSAACPPDLATIASEVCTLLGGALVQIANEMTSDAATLDTRSAEAISASTGGDCCDPATAGITGLTAGTLVLNAADGTGGFLASETEPAETVPTTASSTASSGVTIQALPDDGSQDPIRQVYADLANPASEQETTIPITQPTIDVAAATANTGEATSSYAFDPNLAATMESIDLNQQSAASIDGPGDTYESTLGGNIMDSSPDGDEGFLDSSGTPLD